MTALSPVSFRKPVESAPRLSPIRLPGHQHARFWTEAEKAVLVARYPAGGAAACQPHLPGRSLPTIYQTARKLGLFCDKSGGGPKRKRWHREGPADLDQRILDAWPTLSGKGAVVRFADDVGVPRWVVSKRATALGLTKAHKKEPLWTAAEDALMSAVPLHDPSACAKIFREHGYQRTPTAITVRAKRLNLSRRTHETLSAGRAARILGVDAKFITARCISGDLSANRRGSKRLPQQGGDAWAIAAADLRTYVIDHLDEIDIRKVDKFAFVDLLTGDGRKAASGERA